MKIAISGAGIAGPTLAWWLQRYGHHPVLFEKAPQLRTGGYVIDFWGVGYDVAEKMGLLPALYQKGYLVNSLRMVNRRGATVADFDVARFRPYVDNRFVSIARGDIASIIYNACGNIETRFDTSIVGILQHPGGVAVHAADGSNEQFDLVVGADGLHSAVRTLAFGPESRFERNLGYHVAAFALPGYRPRDELTYLMHTAPKRQISRMSLRDDMSFFFFVFRDELLDRPPLTASDQKTALRRIFGGMQWEVPQILSQLDEVDDLYFDGVSQIRMDRWTNGRAALIGDAAACVSFLAGEGTGLAMTEAYILAGELHRAQGNIAQAFQAYESMLHPFLLQKQNSAQRIAGFFAPKNRWALFLHDLAIKACSIPWFGPKLIGRGLRRAVKDDFNLPDYPD
jgi:2-polyprenyl-6-methoxyphenol hydroxylase-like FAD-dependent oxidoreductase